jgi:type I restriction enzyme M protein
MHCSIIGQCIRRLKNISADTNPKQFIHKLSEDLLETFSNLQLIDRYDVYQHLMTYWMETMQDDCYLIVTDGWKAGNEVEWDKKEFEGKLIPKKLLIKRYFDAEQRAIEQLEAEKDAITNQLEELIEEHSGEDGYFADFEKVSKNTVQARLKEITPAKKQKLKEDLSLAAEDNVSYGEKAILEQYLHLTEKLTKLNTKLKETKADLDNKLLAKYGSVQTQLIASLSIDDIKTLAVADKWMATIEHTVKNEMQRISQHLTQRIKELAERYEIPMPQLIAEVSKIEEKVNAHLAKMGFVWG